MATTGQLELTVVEARLTRDTEAFGKMDPYVKISTRQQNFRTNVKDGAGKTPVWNQKFNIDVKYVGDDIDVTVMDEDVGSDDMIGTAKFKLSALCVNTGIDEWFQITYKGKQAGQVHLKTVWRPQGGNMAQGAQMMQQPGMMQPGMQQPMMQPGMMQPGMQQPMMQPGMQQPMMQPGMMQPGMQQPMMQPGMQQPMMQPGMQQPMMQPGMQQPMMQPGMQQPMMQPGMQQQPMMMQPGMQQPMMMQPGMHPQGMAYGQPKAVVVTTGGHHHHKHHKKHKKYKHKKFKLKKFF